MCYVVFKYTEASLICMPKVKKGSHHGWRSKAVVEVGHMKQPPQFSESIELHGHHLDCSHPFSEENLTLRSLFSISLTLLASQSDMKEKLLIFQGSWSIRCAVGQVTEHKTPTAFFQQNCLGSRGIQSVVSVWGTFVKTNHSDQYNLFPETCFLQQKHTHHPPPIKSTAPGYAFPLLSSKNLVLLDQTWHTSKQFKHI